MAKSKTVKKIIVLGHELEDETIYEIVAKRPDESAPDLYVKMGSEKHLNPNVSNLISFVAPDGYWDTGFYGTSQVFRKMGLTPEEAEVEAKNYRDFIAEPMIRFDKRYEKLLEPSTENTFLDDITTDIRIGKQYNTKDPRQRLELYMAIVGGFVAPTGYRTSEEKDLNLLDENHTVYKLAQYCVEAKDKVRSIEEKRASVKMTANANFMNLLTTKKKLLVSLLNYVGVRASEQETNDKLSARAYIYFEDIVNCETFNEAVDKSEKDPVFKEEVKIMDILRNERGMLLLEKAGREYMLNGRLLGTTDKQISTAIARDADLLQEFYSKTLKK